uniref:glutathione transferase n=1 Tax=Bursaphelenchus xylophilus TaxID=6326 RepID=A0A1I7SRG3_BURXY
MLEEVEFTQGPVFGLSGRKSHLHAVDVTSLDVHPRGRPGTKSWACPTKKVYLADWSVADAGLTGNFFWKSTDFAVDDPAAGRSVGDAFSFAYWMLEIVEKLLALCDYFGHNVLSMPGKLPIRTALVDMPEYKLTYFDCRAYAEPIRLCLHYGGIEFEDYKFTAEQWPAIKPTTPHGVVPVFEVDGKILTQSGAILRYVARLTGLVGKDSWEEAKADETYHYFVDSTHVTSAGGYIYDKAGILKSADIKAFYDVFVKVATKNLDNYTKMLEEARNGYLLKSGLTYADFVVYSHSLTLRNVDPELAKKFPKVYEFVQRIEKLPQLQKYLKERPDTLN